MLDMITENLPTVLWVLPTAVGLYIYYWLHGTKPLITVSPEVISNPQHITAKILAQCPTISKRFIPSFWFVSGHLQTIGASMLRRTPDVEFEREFVTMKDGGVVSLDWISINKDNTQTSDRNTVTDHDKVSSPKVQDVMSYSTVPTIIVLHGLTGGSNESYVRHIILEARKNHFNCVAFNYRGAAGVPLKTPIGYSAAWTEDMRAVVKHVKQKLPHSPLFAIGFSLGANILVKYVGEEGNSIELSGAVSISNPFKLVSSSHHLDNSWLHKNVYSRKLGSNLKNFLRRHLDVIQYSKTIDLENLWQKAVTVRDFDEYVTRRAFGFESVDAYYTAASSADYLKSVRIPLLCLSAMDDPIVPPQSIPFKEAEANPNVILVTTKRGGHVAWVQGFNLFHLKNSWMDKTALEFIVSVSKLASKAL